MEGFRSPVTLKKTIDDDYYPKLLTTLVSELGITKRHGVQQYLDREKIPSKYARVMYHHICILLMESVNMVGMEHEVVKNILSYHQANATIGQDIDFPNVRYINDHMTTLISKEIQESKRSIFQFYRETLILTASSPEYLADNYKNICLHCPLSRNDKKQHLEIKPWEASEQTGFYVIGLIDEINHNTKLSDGYKEYRLRYKNEM